MSTLLTKPQRVMLTGIARRAWTQRRDAKATDATFDQWRHTEAIAACGSKISEAKRSDFDALFTAFKALAGDVSAAFDHALGAERGATNDWRGWQRQILAQLARASLPWSYSQRIAQTKFRQDLETLSPDQMKAVFLDTRRAVNAKLKRASATTQAAIADAP